MEQTATVPADAAGDMNTTATTEPSAEVATEETQNEGIKETSEVAPEVTSESGARRRSSRLGSSASKPPAPPPTEKKKRGPKKRTADEADKDETPTGNGSAKKVNNSYYSSV